MQPNIKPVCVHESYIHYNPTASSEQFENCLACIESPYWSKSFRCFLCSYSYSSWTVSIGCAILKSNVDSVIFVHMLQMALFFCIIMFIIHISLRKFTSKHPRLLDEYFLTNALYIYIEALPTGMLLFL